MKKKIDRSKLLVILGIIFCGVISLSVVYAALSTTLNINGNATLSGSNFSLSVEYLSSSETASFVGNGYLQSGTNGMVSGSGRILNYGSINGSQISNISYTLTKPGDETHLFYKVTNSGSIPMTYTGVDIYEPQITGNASEEQLDSINAIGDTFDLDIDEVLCPGQSFIMVISVEFDKNADFVFSNNVVLSGLGGELYFEQAEKSSCS